MDVLEHVSPPPKRSRLWYWFKEHAKSRLALLWLALIAFADTLFSPITTEAFLMALVLAHRDRWRAYLPVAWIFSILGATTGYWLFYALYRSFGEALLASWGFSGVFAAAQDLMGAQIFFTMFIASFTPLPDKLFIYAAGILGAPFIPFIVAFAIGRGLRMSVVTYVVWKFGEPVLEMIDRYAVWSTVVAVAVFGIYVILRLNLLPW